MRQNLQSLSCYVNRAQQNSPGDELWVLRTGGANGQSFFLALCLKNNSLLFKDEIWRDMERLPQATALAGVMCWCYPRDALGEKKQDLDAEWPPGSLLDLSPSKLLIGAMWGFSLGSTISGMLDALVVTRAHPCDTQLLLNCGLRTFIFVVGAKSGTVRSTDLSTVKISQTYFQHLMQWFCTAFP